MDKSPFAQRLLNRLNEIGMNMSQLSEISGVPYHQIHTWTRRENAKPKAESVISVAKALDVSPDHLLSGSPLPEQQTRLRAELETQLNILSEEELRVLLAAAKAMRAPETEVDG